MSRSKVTVLERLADDLGPVQYEGLTEHLVKRMKNWVVQGLVKPGERLPPERELATMLNVSRASLRQALKVLQVMGVLETRQGSGNALTQNAESILRQPTDLLIPLRGMSFGEASATILPAHAPTVPTYGRPTMRALNQPWPPVFFARLKISNSDLSFGSN